MSPFILGSAENNDFFLFSSKETLEAFMDVHGSHMFVDDQASLYRHTGIDFIVEPVGQLNQRLLVQGEWRVTFVFAA